MKRVLSSLLVALGLCFIGASFSSVIHASFDLGDVDLSFWELHTQVLPTYVRQIGTWGLLPLAAAIFFWKGRMEGASKSEQPV